MIYDLYKEHIINNFHLQDRILFLKLRGHGIQIYELVLER